MSPIAVDYLVVGSGLTGGTIARRLADAGREVLVLERREHLGGNVHDTLHPSGAVVHSYGPHYFRCSSPRIWEFVNRFAEFRPYHPEVKTMVDGHYEEWPVNETLLDGWLPPSSRDKPRNFEEACLLKLPERIYEKMVKGYTFKQWGVPPSQLGPALAQRVRINGRNQSSLAPHHVHQALPLHGYSSWMRALTAGIACLHGVDYLMRRGDFRARKLLVCTGSIDEFFNFEEGRLGYRGQHRTLEFFPHLGSYQPCVQVNHPNGAADAPLRTIEWKYLTPKEQRQRIVGTVVTHERPYTPAVPDAFEYPFPDAANQALYRRYRARAAREQNILICGRLGDYRYYDMDQAIGRALLLADRILSKR